jgi:hypothetical protein
MKNVLSALAVVLFGLLPSLTASDQSLAEDNLKLAQELVEAMHLDQGMLAKMQSMQNRAMGSMMTNASPQMQEVMQKSMQTTMATVSATMTPEKIRDMYVSVYASVYSAEELRGAIDFYKSPVGQKWLEKQPQATALIMAKTMEMMPSFDSIKKTIQAMNTFTNGSNGIVTPSPSPVPSVSP